MADSRAEDGLVATDRLAIVTDVVATGLGTVPDSSSAVNENVWEPWR
ncbi:MAG: hypothetical protein ACRDMX_12705 [Solirubrobacteraceae bacterium]